MQTSPPFVSLLIRPVSRQPSTSAPFLPYTHCIQTSNMQGIFPTFILIVSLFTTSFKPIICTSLRLRRSTYPTFDLARDQLSKTSIAKNKEAAQKQEKEWQARDGIRVYTGSSDFEGGVGTAVLLYRMGKLTVPMLKMYLGPSNKHTVFEAELVGLIIALELIQREHSAGYCSIGADN